MSPLLPDEENEIILNQDGSWNPVPVDEEAEKKNRMEEQQLLFWTCLMTMMIMLQHPRQHPRQKEEAQLTMVKQLFLLLMKKQLFLLLLWQRLLLEDLLSVLISTDLVPCVNLKEKIQTSFEWRKSQDE